MFVFLSNISYTQNNQQQFENTKIYQCEYMNEQKMKL